MSTKLQADQIARWAESRAQQPMTGKEPSAREQWQIVQASERPGVTLKQLAAEFGLPPEKIAEVLAVWTDTTVMAKRRLKAGADNLADRFLKDADPGEAMEMLARLDVVQGSKGSGDSGVTVIVGGGGLVNVGVLLAPPAPVIDTE